MGYASSITRLVEEVTSTAELDGYDRSTTVAVNGGHPADTDNTTITLFNQGTGTVSFTNAYEQQPVSFEISKTDGNDQPLSGAVFSLTAFDGEQWYDIEKNIPVDSSGKASVSDLRYDTLYCLTETSAPVGYNLLTSPIYFKITISGGTPFLHPCDIDGNVILNWPTHVSPLTPTAIGLKITNIAAMVLPETGGIGTRHIQFTGLCLLAASILFAYRIKRKCAKGGFE